MTSQVKSLAVAHNINFIHTCSTICSEQNCMNMDAHVKWRMLAHSNHPSQSHTNSVNFPGDMKKIRSLNVVASFEYMFPAKQV